MIGTDERADQQSNIVGSGSMLPATLRSRYKALCSMVSKVIFVGVDVLWYVGYIQIVRFVYWWCVVYRFGIQ
jgi:hypothetical protein